MRTGDNKHLCGLCAPGFATQSIRRIVG